MRNATKLELDSFIDLLSQSNILPKIVSVAVKFGNVLEGIS